MGAPWRKELWVGAESAIPIDLLGELIFNRILWFLLFIFHFCGAALAFSGFRESCQASWFSLHLRGKGVLKCATSFPPSLPPYGNVFCVNQWQKSNHWKYIPFPSLQSSPSPKTSLRMWLKPKHFLSYKGIVLSWWSQLEMNIESQNCLGLKRPLNHQIQLLT